MCFFFKQKTAYEVRISDGSSDVCSSDLLLMLGSWLAVERRGMLIDGSYPVVAATLIYVILAYAGFASAERQRKDVSRAFERYLSPVQLGGASCQERVCKYV